jgi:hypothetical protein
MKRLFSILAACALLTAVNLQAQVASNSPPTAESAVTTVFNWVTTGVDTNDTTFNLAACTLRYGNSFVNNADNATTFGADLNLWHPSSAVTLAIESDVRNAGVVGKLYSAEAGLLLYHPMFNIRVGGYVDGGYSWLDHSPTASAGLDASKDIGKSSAVYLRLGYQYSFKTHQQAGIFETGIRAILF